MDTTASRERRRTADALLWAAGVSWLGALLIGALMLFVNVLGDLFFAFVEIFTGPLSGDTSGWLLGVALTAMATSLLSALGSAWVLVQTPGSNAPPWLVGALCGVLGWAVGGGVLYLVLGS